MLRMEPPAIIDWIVVSLRWLVLLIMAVSASIQGSLNQSIVLVFLAAGLWNILLIAASAFLLKGRYSRYSILIGDLTLAISFFIFGRGASGNFEWMGVLPVMSGALYYRWQVGTLVAFITVLVQGILAVPVSEQVVESLSLIVSLPVYLVVAIILGFCSKRLYQNVDPVQSRTASQKLELREQERDRNRTIYRLINQLSGSLDYQRVLDMALDAANSSLSSPAPGSEQLVSAVYQYKRDDRGEMMLQVGSARRYTPDDLRVTLEGVQGLLNKVVDDRQAQLSKELAQDPELRRITALHSCQSAYCIPLRSGLDVYGVLLYAHPSSDFFTIDRCEILDVIASQAMVAYQNARLYHELEKEKERTTAIQEDVRRKLARDLHDGPTQSVAALAMRTNFARRLIDKDVHAASEELHKIEDLARQTTKEIRHMLFTLRPLVLESHGLVAALETMAEKMRETFGQDVLVEADPELVSRLEMGKQNVIFYITEEAANNARKHARASHIWIRLKPADHNMIELEIEDDGVGFNLDSVDGDYESSGSLGLLNMRERAALINGVLKVVTSAGSGTCISVLIPLTEDAADRLRYER